MSSSPRNLRRSLMALLAVFAASLSASEAAACTSMKSAAQTCATACGCCTSESSEVSSTRAPVATHATVPQAPGVGQPAPAEVCTCRSQEPAAPSPKPARTTAESRPEPGHSSEFVHFGEAFAARTALARQVPATQSPPKVPLYLRNERLLF